jgi:hypothetical protein
MKIDSQTRRSMGVRVSKAATGLGNTSRQRYKHDEPLVQRVKREQTAAFVCNPVMTVRVYDLDQSGNLRFGRRRAYSHIVAEHVENTARIIDGVKYDEDKTYVSARAQGREPWWNPSKGRMYIGADPAEVWAMLYGTTIKE